LRIGHWQGHLVFQSAVRKGYAVAFGSPLNVARRSWFFLNPQSAIRNPQSAIRNPQFLYVAYAAITFRMAAAISCMFFSVYVGKMNVTNVRRSCQTALGTFTRV